MTAPLGSATIDAGRWRGLEICLVRSVARSVPPRLTAPGVMNQAPTRDDYDAEGVRHSPR